MRLNPDRSRFHEAVVGHLGKLGHRVCGTDFGRSDEGLFHKITTLSDGGIETFTLRVPAETSPWDQNLIQTLCDLIKGTD